MTEAILLQDNLLDKMIQAAKALEPVVVNLGPLQPHFRSYIDSVNINGNKKLLILSPIATRALPEAIESSFRITPLDINVDWVLLGSNLYKIDDQSAAIDLSDARLANKTISTNNSIMQIASDPLIFVVPAGISDNKAHIFPISEISSDSCIIEASSPFELGTILPMVEIIGDKCLLRKASAQIVEVEPWFMPDGSQRFRCLFTLRICQIDNPDKVFDEVKDVRRVRKIMDLAGMLTAFGWYDESSDSQGTIRFVQVDRDTATLEYLYSRQGKFQERTSISIGVEIFAIYYKMDVRILEVNNNLIKVTLPLSLKRRRRHRRAERVTIPEGHNINIRFCNPATGQTTLRRVAKISYVGLTFDAKHNDPLWQDLILEQAELSWRNRTILLGDLIVRSLSEPNGVRLCHTSINKPNIVNDQLLIDLIATLSHPDIIFHDGSDFDSLVDIYIQAGLFAPHMHRNLDPMIQQAKEVWTRLHRDASDVVRTLVKGPLDAPNIAMTSIRGWERAWMAQHFVSIDPKFDKAIGRLQLAQLDHVMPRSDGHFILFFVKADNRIMNSFLQRFFMSTGTTDSLKLITIELWSRRGELSIVKNSNRSDYLIQPLNDPDQELVSRAAQRSLGILPTAALSMVPGEFTLPHSTKSFARAGLLRDRQCRIIADKGRPVYAVLEERSSPGLNLTWMLNSNWIIPIHPRLDPDGKVLLFSLQHIIETPAQSPLGERFLNVPPNIPHRPLLDAGFQLVAPVNLYVLNRAGLQRYYYYAASRYGEVSALIQRRNVKKKTVSSSASSERESTNPFNI